MQDMRLTCVAATSALMQCCEIYWTFVFGHLREQRCWNGRDMM